MWDRHEYTFAGLDKTKTPGFHICLQNNKIISNTSFSSSFFRGSSWHQDKIRSVLLPLSTDQRWNRVKPCFFTPPTLIISSFDNWILSDRRFVAFVSSYNWPSIFLWFRWNNTLIAVLFFIRCCCCKDIQKGFQCI